MSLAMPDVVLAGAVLEAGVVALVLICPLIQSVKRKQPGRESQAAGAVLEVGAEVHVLIRPPIQYGKRRRPKWESQAEDALWGAGEEARAGRVCGGMSEN